MASDETDWGAVTARSLAYIAMTRAELADKTIAERGEFLLSLGIPRAEAAAMLGTSDDSLRVNMATRAKAAAKKSGKGTK